MMSIPAVTMAVLQSINVVPPPTCIERVVLPAVQDHAPAIRRGCAGHSVELSPAVRTGTANVGPASSAVVYVFCPESSGDAHRTNASSPGKAGREEGCN